MTSPRDTRLLKLLLTAESALEHIHPPIRAADDDLISYPVYVIGDRIVRTVTTFTKFFNVDPSCPEQLRVMSFSRATVRPRCSLKSWQTERRDRLTARRSSCRAGHE